MFGMKPRVEALERWQNSTKANDTAKAIIELKADVKILIVGIAEVKTIALKNQNGISENNAAIAEVQAGVAENTAAIAEVHKGIDEVQAGVDRNFKEIQHLKPM